MLHNWGQGVKETNYIMEPTKIHGLYDLHHRCQYYSWCLLILNEFPVDVMNNAMLLCAGEEQIPALVIRRLAITKR